MRPHHTEHFKVCPWGLALRDHKISQWLLASGLISKWGRWPPGRDDPQLLEAVIIIASEQERAMPQQKGK